MAESTAPPDLVLYDWAPSPFCMKIRAVLAHKGLPYRKIPALTRIREITRRGGIGKVPALELDGEFHVDSTDIAHLLEQRFPQAPILPADPRQRALCHVLEEYCDEALYFPGLYFHWHEPAGQARARAYFGRTLVGRVIFPFYLRRIEGQLRGQGTGRKSPERIRADLARNLDSLEALLEGRAFLLGEGPHLCDFALAGQLRYLTLAPATGEVLQDRPRLRELRDRLTEELQRPRP